ncbi:MAG: hypothetical protein KKH83_03950 [Candidatus Margulisbacteria bacterium]|nr:hypothetical protein [Candidatus Margulisiibacteriota bacterium]
MSINECQMRGINTYNAPVKCQEARDIQMDNKDKAVLEELLALTELLSFMGQKFDEFDAAKKEINEKRDAEVSRLYYEAREEAQKEASYADKSEFGQKIREYGLTVTKTKKERVTKKLSNEKEASFDQHIVLFEKMAKALAAIEAKKTEVKNKLKSSKARAIYSDMELSERSSEKNLRQKEADALLSAIGVFALEISWPSIKLSLGVTNGWVKHLQERLDVFAGLIKQEIEKREASIKGHCVALYDKFKPKEAPRPAIVKPAAPKYSIPFNIAMQGGYVAALGDEGVSSLGAAVKAEGAFAMDDWAVGAHYLGEVPFDLAAGEAVSGHDLLMVFGKYQTPSLGLLGQVAWEYRGSAEEEFDALGVRLGYDQLVWNKLGLNARFEMQALLAGDRIAAGAFDGVLTAGLHWKEAVAVPFADVIAGYEYGAFDVGGMAGVGLPFASGHELDLAVSYTTEKGLSAYLHHTSKVHQNVELGAKAEYSYDLSSHEINGEAFAVFPIGRVGGEDMGLQLTFEGNSNKEVGGGLSLFWGRPITPSYLPKERPYSQEPFGEQF